MKNNNKLSIEQKLEISMSTGESLRKLAKKYGVHHSSIDDIKKESLQAMQKYWQDKSLRLGRPAKAQESIAKDNFEKEKFELRKEADLKQIKIDWLELQLEMQNERLEEAKLKCKHVKKKDKIKKLNLINMHEENYSYIKQEQRLHPFNMSVKGFRYFQASIEHRLKTECCIPELDIEEVIKLIIRFPYLGGEKGSLKLLNDFLAYIGATYYAEIKYIFRQLAEKELVRRLEKSLLEVNYFKRRTVREEYFKELKVEKPHDVWAIDFLQISLFSVVLNICVVYELYSGAYLSILADESATKEVALQAVNEAVEYSKAKPAKCLLSDNGSHFVNYKFDEMLKELKITGMNIPAGKPWFNGALESGNRDLKKVIYTQAFYKACDEIAISLRRTSRQQILDFLNECCKRTQLIINEQIVRPKTTFTPDIVLSGKTGKQTIKRAKFILDKMKERQKNREKLKNNKNLKRKNLEEKVHSAWSKISKQMPLDKLYAFTELVNNRYAKVAY